MNSNDFWEYQSSRTKELQSSDEYTAWMKKEDATEVNRIIRCVNEKIPEKEASLSDPGATEYYRYLMDVANAHQESYGSWPVFDLMEIE